jgi:hypothetical protein
MRETGLEAADAIGYGRSCFKASSGDHPKLTIALYQQVLYRPPSHMQANSIFISKICIISRFPARNHETKPAILQTMRSRRGYYD